MHFCIKRQKLLICENVLDDISAEELREELPERQPRFVVYSFKLAHSDNRVSYPMCLLYSTPRDCKIELQVMYAGTKLSLVKEAELTKKVTQTGLQEGGVATKNSDLQGGKFETQLEEFYGICDQIELNLKSAIDCINQTESSNSYMRIPPVPNRLDTTGNQTEFLSYPQYIAISKQQINFSNEVRHLLSQAAEDVVKQNH
ncbi:hypothetical protein TCAL_05717 [Tigriopus californicus]|uniref:Mediator of RNA polymerase II transcription subunit 29 n=1 Tax=Tigriopus californicus TaxID=6832 RepID=A0A553N848_TIGCA|nr:hypothetical protein TCAL_05717 [Tigriopus californicus]